MKHFRSLCLFLLMSTISFSQNKFNQIATIEIEADFITTDNQANSYVVKGNELTKYNKTGKLLYKFSNNKLGNITFVDASNMLNLLVFYKDFSTVLFLDNTLSLSSGPISLDKTGFQQAQLVCSSHNSSMWIYDQQNFELLRIDKKLEIQQKTGNLAAVLNNELQPTYLLEYDNNVYLNNPKTGILIFDIYGTYYKTIPLIGLNYFQVIGDCVYYTIDNKVKSYNIKTAEEKQFDIPLSEFKKFRLEMGILVIQNQKAIRFYSSE